MGRRAPLPRQAGFTLVETLVALLVVMLALTLGLGFLAQQPRLLARLEAREAAQHYLEDSLETLRAGGLELRSGEAVWRTAPPSDRGLGLALELDVSEAESEDLYDVVLSARYRLEGRDRRATVATKVWRP